MRNVTIVESNVEPNKEHLWFYNGKLKWFGPNGWEEIYSQALSPTTTPKPVVPPTTTTSTTPGPGVATTPIGMRVYNYMDVTIDTIVFGANSVNRYIPANGDVYIEEVYPSTSGGNITLYIKARGSGSTSSGAQVNRFLDVNIMGEISGTSVQQFKSILNEGTIDIPYTGSDALHSISLVVSISDGDTTTTSSPIPGTDVRFTNNTNTDIQIYGVLYNGDTASPPMQPGQTYILRYISDGVAVYNSPYYTPFDSLKITAFRGKVQEEVPYIIDTDTICNGVMYKFPEELSWGEITEISIEGSIQGTGTTSSTPTPNSIKFTNMTDVSLTLTRVNSVDEGLQVSIQPNQQYTLVHNANDANTNSYIEIFATLAPNSIEALPPFSFLKITAFNYEGLEYDVPYEHGQDAMGVHLYKFSFKELIEKGFTLVSINGNISTTTTTTTTTTSSSTPTPITEQEIPVSNIIGGDGPIFGITMDDNTNFNNVVPSRLETLRNCQEIYVTYTPSSRYLAVVSPKTNGFKDTIVATILVPVDGGPGYEGHTLYPINSMDNESNKYFLFDLSKSPYVGTAAYSNPRVELRNYNSHSISSIPPFIDGNIPPFADEK